MQDLEQNMGGVEPKYDVSNIGGVQANMTNSDRGREGVKNHENLADVICACPLAVYTSNSERSVARSKICKWPKWGQNMARNGQI